MNENDNRRIDEQIDHSVGAQEDQPLQDAGAANEQVACPEPIGAVSCAAEDGGLVTTYPYPAPAPRELPSIDYSIYVFDRRDEMTDIYHYSRAETHEGPCLHVYGPGDPGDILLEHERVR